MKRGRPFRVWALWPGLVLSAVAGIGAAPHSLAAQTAPARQAGTVRSQVRRISVTWTEAPIGDVLRAFAAFSGTSIVAGANVTGFVTADINDQPWDAALRTILAAQGLVAVEDEHGIIRVDNMEELGRREAIEPILTRSYRISFSRASELQAAIAPLLSQRGSVSTVPSTNTLVVSDIARVQRAVAALLR